MTDEAQAADAGSRYPFINLEKAMGRAKELFVQAGDHEALVADAFTTWDYSQKSSGGHQTVAALKMYGLLVATGNADQRKLALSPEALRYFRDEREDVHASLRRTFALRPKLLQALWEKWGVSPPADNIARSHLKIDRHLSEQGARSLLGIYKDNLDFADLKGSGKIPEESKEETPPASAEGGGKPLPGEKPLPGKGRRIDLMENERVLSDGLLSKTATYRVIVSGPIGPKEIDRLIKKLEVDKEILSDTDGADDEDET